MPRMVPRLSVTTGIVNAKKSVRKVDCATIWVHHTCHRLLIFATELQLQLLPITRCRVTATVTAETVTSKSGIARQFASNNNVVTSENNPNKCISRIARYRMRFRKTGSSRRRSKCAASARTAALFKLTNHFQGRGRHRAVGKL